MNFAQHKEAVQSSYDTFAKTGMAESLAPAARAFCHKRYGAERLNAVSQGALELACGCGDPLGVAGIGLGYSVVDLGCGGGLDVVLAARAAGEWGRVVGLDLAPELIEAARRAADESGVAGRLHFRVADLEKMALLPRVFANVATTNCVIGFCVDKLTVYRNIFRILKPGGILVACELMSSGDEAAGGAGESGESGSIGSVDSIGESGEAGSQPEGAQCLYEIASPAEHLGILERLSFDVLDVERAPLAAPDLAVIAGYPGMAGALLAEGRVEAVTVIAKRRPLN